MAYVSEECKRSVKNVEDKLSWARKALSDYIYADVAFPNMIAFLASSFRYHSANLDKDCKDFFKKCEDKLLLVAGHSTAAKIDSIDALLSEMNQYIG
jgi:hypothetical protein